MYLSLDLNSDSSFVACHSHGLESHLQDEGRHREDHGFIEDGVRVVPFGGSFLLADLPAVLQEIDFDKRI